MFPGADNRFSAPFPVGVNPPENRQPITKVACGDSIVFRDIVFDFDGVPVNPDNSILSFAIKDQRFSEGTVWTGGWMDGILSLSRPGQIEISVPDVVSASLRRGAYIHSLLVTDKFGCHRKTCMSGSLLVEYEATSPHVDIPYKSGADPHQSYQPVSSNPKCVTGVNFGNQTYSPDPSGVVYIPGGSGYGSLDRVILPCEGKRYRLRLKLVDGLMVSYWTETDESVTPATATLDGVTYVLKLTEVDGVLTSYWERYGDA